MKNHEQNEARVLYFHRARLSDDVCLATVKLRRGETSTWHRHSATRDTFYVMKGRLTITLAPGSASPAYHGITASPVEAVGHEAPEGAPCRRAILQPGDVFVIEPGVAHCAANRDEDVCEFLCIEGVGSYDFVELDGPTT